MKTKISMSCAVLMISAFAFGMGCGQENTVANNASDTSESSDINQSEIDQSSQDLASGKKPGSKCEEDDECRAFRVKIDFGGGDFEWENISQCAGGQFEGKQGYCCNKAAVSGDTGCERCAKTTGKCLSCPHHFKLKKGKCVHQ